MDLQINNYKLKPMCPRADGFTRYVPAAQDYPLLAAHKVHILDCGKCTGVDSKDFARALSERHLTEWFDKLCRADTQGTCGMYPWDAESYLSRTPIFD